MFRLLDTGVAAQPRGCLGSQHLRPTPGPAVETLDQEARMAAASPASVKVLTLNTTLAMVGATLVTILLHELAHAVAAMAQGSAARLFPFASLPVRELPPVGQLVELLAGPVFGLLLGLVLLAVLRPGPRPGFGYLWLTWLGFTSAMEGIGYLILTPFGIGDTGTAALNVGLQPVLGWAAAVLSVGGMLLLARSYGRRIARLVPHGDLPRLRGLSFFPWLIGTLALVAITLLWIGVSAVEADPGSVIAVIMATVAIGVWAPMAMPFTVGVPASQAGDSPLQLPGVSRLGVGLLVAVLIVDAILTRGPQLG